ncbi:metalloregulator ArsR/SmtB family transcription factor [Jeotgalibacillus sp. ET6]|uniref:ArsR/SmtB family transcription factor n=1 Tax=Jeotgalibacillus sp. ET6 TaxID=3037260 RepID=UPI0024182A40|nr:metalloregulator ArsR/SmtB family transcription factor [Jeotgalibacillus sp. ET6]MDG5470481.1 metalloregulator ArsR/SmtB family transcription factor [Jeotgalibacillus sp. ET6]
MTVKNHSPEALAEIYRLFGDKTRLLMAKKLSEEEWTVSQFVDLFMISQPLVSQHIKKLKDAELIAEQRAGKRILYRLDPKSARYPLIIRLIEPITEESTGKKEV